MSARGWPFDPLRPFGYDVVVVDPPWHFELRSARGEAKSPQAQYATMGLDDIMALPVGDLVAPGGVVWMWCTWPLVAGGVHAAVMRRWGIEPKTGGVWAKRTASGKLRMGPGYILRTVCEPFLIGTLPGADWHGASIRNLIETVEAISLDGVAREHSRKPEESYALIEAAMPKARRADLFARQSRVGWDAWGDEAGKFDSIDSRHRDHGAHRGSAPAEAAGPLCGLGDLRVSNPESLP